MGCWRPRPFWENVDPRVREVGPRPELIGHVYHLPRSGKDPAPVNHGGHLIRRHVLLDQKLAHEFARAIKQTRSAERVILPEAALGKARNRCFGDDPAGSRLVRDK